MNMFLMRIRKTWRELRHLTGDDAYERYLEHWRLRHAGADQPLDREAFLRRETERRWNGIKRCC